MKINEHRGKIICLVIPTFLVGGMERALSELANYFSMSGIQVHVVFLIRHQPFYDINKGIKLYFPDFKYGKSSVSKIIFRLRTIFFQRKIIRQISPDVVFSIPQGYNNLTILALLGSEIPVYVSVRNSPVKKISLLRRILRKVIYPFAAGIVAQTKVAQEILKSYNKNIKVIPNSVKSIKAYPKTVNKCVILNVGRLERGKNQMELIEIFSKIDNEGWELWFVGEGPMREELEKRINGLKLNDKVFLKGQLKNIDEIMGQTDIFAFTSLSEGFPNSLLEAKAYPLACIAFDCVAGPRDIIENNVDGFLVEVGDVQEYTNKLGLLMRDRQLRDKFKERGVITRRKHLIDKIGNEYLEFFFRDSFLGK